MTFYDWDPLQRREVTLRVAVERLSICRPSSSDDHVTLHRTGAPSDAVVTEGENTSRKRSATQAVVVVDVTDKDGVKRSIEVREDDEPLKLAELYAASVPGGLTSRQFAKLLHILESTAQSHFLRHTVN